MGVERIALLLCAHAVPGGETIINIEKDEQQDGNEEYTFQDRTHSIDSLIEPRTRIRRCVSKTSRSKIMCRSPVPVRPGRGFCVVFGS